MEKRMSVRLTPLGVQVGKFLTERPLSDAVEQMEIVEILTPLYKASGRDMCDLFDEYYSVENGHAAQIKDLPDPEWPEVVGQ